jgi:hypothetical protein
MSNPIKYSTGSESLALKSGNFYIGTGDVSKGPTNDSGFWNGLNPPASGYTIYLNKESGGPAVYSASNDEELVTLTKIISGQNLTTKQQCLAYFVGQTDKIVTNMDYPPIITDGLVMSFDQTYTLGYAQSGSTIYDMTSGSSYSGNIYGNPSWANNISALTICLLITKTGTGTGYANHPVNKWNSGYNVNASFVLYHFENYQGNNQDGKLGWYGYGTNGGWRNIGTYGFTTMTTGQTFWVGLQYNSSQGGQAWVNGNKSGDRSGIGGNLGPTTSTTNSTNIFLPYQGSPIGTRYVSHILFYNRELSDAEMLKNYNAVSSRVVI